MNKKLILTGLLLIMFIHLALGVNARMDIIDNALSPFSNVSISGLYDRHSFFFDLIIYTIAFIGIARVSLGKRFQGKGSNMLINAIGIILALSLALVGKSMGFTIKSFGPLSAVILILVVGMGAYHIIKSTGLNVAGSGALSLVLIYFITNSLSPGLFSWVESVFPWIHLLFLVALIVSILGVFAKLAKPRFAFAMPEVAKTIPEEVRDEEMIEQEVNEEIRVSEKQIHTLRDIIHKIDSGFNNDRDRMDTAGILDMLKAKLIEDMKVLWKIKKFTEKVENITVRQFKTLKTKYGKLDKKHRRNALNDLFIEEKKEKFIRNMKKVAGFMESRHKYLIYNINQAQENMVKNKLKISKKHLETAVQVEKELEKYLKRIKGYDKAVEHLTRAIK